MHLASLNGKKFQRKPEEPLLLRFLKICLIFIYFGSYFFFITKFTKILHEME